MIGTFYFKNYKSKYIFKIFKYFLFSLKRVERKIMKQREILKQNNEERRSERQVKNEAIRIKYG